MSAVNKSSQIFCAWSGIVYAAILAVAMCLVAPFFPPPRPSADILETTRLFQDSGDRIRACGVLWMLASGFYIPYISVIFVQMKRIEGEFCVLSYVQLIGGVMTLIVTCFAGILWCVATFREGTAPEVIQTLNDLSWFTLFFNISAACIQNLCIGIVGLGDKREHPIFPRWLCYFNIWLAISFLPDILIPYFKIGPFAWNGVLAFTLPMSAFFVWFVVMVPALIGAVRRQAEEAGEVQRPVPGHVAGALR